ncbi:hypothetical protein C0J52_28488, partial [Blattella germanica]
SFQGCVAVISLTWVTSVTLFAVMVLPRGGYYFNTAGLLACDTFFSRPSLRILSSCLFYFPTTMILMYCYGSAFHVNKLRLKRVVCSAIATSEDVCLPNMEKFMAQERRLRTNVSRTMAAMSLGFIVMVTPWTIQEVVAACTGTKLFCQSKETFSGKVRCCSSNSSTMGQVQTTYPMTSGSHEDFDGFNEKYWGEILERTVSSNSLQKLQKIYGPPHPFLPPQARPNGKVVSELRLYESRQIEI